MQYQLVGRELIEWLAGRWAGHMLLAVVDCSRPWAEGGGEWRALEPDACDAGGDARSVYAALRQLRCQLQV